MVKAATSRAIALFKAAHESARRSGSALRAPLRFSPRRNIDGAASATNILNWNALRVYFSASSRSAYRSQRRIAGLRDGLKRTLSRPSGGLTPASGENCAYARGWRRISKRAGRSSCKISAKRIRLCSKSLWRSRLHLRGRSRHGMLLNSDWRRL